MSILGGKNGFIECKYDFMLLAHTNEEIAAEAQYKAWWDGFADIQAVSGLSEGLRLIAAPDQRAGQSPKWKYMVAFGFSGDVPQLKKAVSAHDMKGDSALWFYEAVCDLKKKEWKPDDEEEHIFMALTSYKPGREDEFHAWYMEYHLPEVVSVSCYRSGRRFRLTAISGADTPWEYLAFYRFVGPARDMHPTLTEEMKSSKLRRTGALADGDAGWLYSAI